MSAPLLRLTTAAACLGLILALGATYTASSEDLPVSWSRALADPASMDGQTMVFTLHQVSRGGDEPALMRVGAEVPLRGELPALSKGETVSVRGQFSAEQGAVLVEELERHPLRRAKAGLSLLGLLIWLASLPLWLRRRGDGLSTRGWLHDEVGRG